jgi:hypothetical protein
VVWDGLCTASVADDTRAPRGTGETCRKAVGTAGGQGEPVSGLLGFDDTDKCLACSMPTRSLQRAMPPWAVALSRQGDSMA